MPSPADPGRRRALLAALAVVALTALALALRGPGLDFLMPHFMHRDGLVVVRMAELFRGGGIEPDRDRLFIAYPHLLPRLLALLPDPVAPLPAGDGALDLAGHLARANAPWVRARLASVLFSLLVVPATYATARRFLERGPSLFAAALVATSLIHVHFSTLSQPHAPAAALVALGVVAALRLRRRPGLLEYAAGAVACAAAAGVLHTGLALLPAFGVAHLLRERSGSRRGALATNLAAAGAIALVAVSVRCFYPWLFSRPRARDEVLPGELPIRTDELFPETFDGSGLGRLVRWLAVYDPLLAGLVALGLLVLVVRLPALAAAWRSERARDLAVVLGHALPYFAVLAAYSGTYERFLMPLFPAFACLAAWGVASLVARLPSGAPRAAAWTLVALSAAFPAAVAARLAVLRARPDTLEVAARWLEQRLEPERGRAIVLPFIDVPVASSEAARAENGERPWTSAWVRYQRDLPAGAMPPPRYTVLLMPGEYPSSRQVLARNPRLYLEAFAPEYVVVAEPEDPLLSEARAMLASEAELVLRLSPLEEDDGGTTALLFHDDGEGFERPFWHQVLRCRRMGPTLEVHRLSREGERRQ